MNNRNREFRFLVVKPWKGLALENAQVLCHYKTRDLPEQGIVGGVWGKFESLKEFEGAQWCKQAYFIGVFIKSVITEGVYYLDEEKQRPNYWDKKNEDFIGWELISNSFEMFNTGNLQKGMFEALLNSDIPEENWNSSVFYLNSFCDVKFIRGVPNIRGEYDDSFISDLSKSLVNN